MLGLKTLGTEPLGAYIWPASGAAAPNPVEDAWDWAEELPDDFWQEEQVPVIADVIIPPSQVEDVWDWAEELPDDFWQEDQAPVVANVNLLLSSEDAWDWTEEALDDPWREEQAPVIADLIIQPFQAEDAWNWFEEFSEDDIELLLYDSYTVPPDVIIRAWDLWPWEVEASEDDSADWYYDLPSSTISPIPPWVTPQVITMCQYEADVADLLHDPNNAFWSLAQIDNYINKARIQVAMDSGCLRSLQASYVTQGQENYIFGQISGGMVLNGGSNYTAPTISFSGGGGTGVAATLGVSNGAVNAITFTNLGSGYTSAPAYTISDATGSGAILGIGVINGYTYDIFDVHVLWGTQRYTLQWQPFSVFSAKFRPWTAAVYQRQPICWAAYGEQSIFIGPAPDQTYAVEFDSVVLPAPLVSQDCTTIDPIPAKYNECVNYYAAHLAKKNAQQFGESESFKAQYLAKLNEVGAAYVRRIPDIYK